MGSTTRTGHYRTDPRTGRKVWVSTHSMATKGATGSEAPASALAVAELDPWADDPGEDWAPPAPREISAGHWEVFSATEPPAEEDSGTPGVRMVRFSITAEPERAAHLAAAVDTFPRDENLTSELDEWVGGERRKATVLMASENTFGAGSVQIREVSLARSTSGGLMFLEKGKRTKGYRLNPERVLSYQEGWGGQRVDELNEQWHAHAHSVPRPQPLTQEDLAGMGEESDDVKFAVFGTHPGFQDGSGKAAGCVWFVTNYDAENDIVDGYMWAPEDSGLVSEHGSIYGRQLMRMGGKVPVPAGMKFKDCFELPAERAPVWGMLR